MDKISFSRERFETFYALLARAASGETTIRQPLTEDRDELDAVAYAVNALMGELNHRVQQAEAANQSKTQFLRNISHELRNPLTAILAAADLINRDSVSHVQRSELIRTIQTNGQNLLHLISDLIDLSKSEAGQFKPEIKSIPLHECLQDVIESMRPAALKKNLTFRFDLCTRVPKKVSTCSQSLRQILVNLIGNAIKFTHHGEIVVSVHADADPVAGPCLVANVKDNGIGIEESAQKNLFQPFVQGGEHIASQFGGSGLGLALSLRLAQALGGDLNLIESEPGRGSTFQLKIPTPSVNAVTNRPRLSGTRILIAEDNQEIRELFETILSIEGACVTSVADGCQALELADGESFDIVLLDINMPILSGIETVRELRKRGCQLPVLAVTADEQCLEPLAILKLGFDDGISKPFAIDQVCNKIVRHCRLSLAEPLYGRDSISQVQMAPSIDVRRSPLTSR